nr:hypothetical protein [Tanacetum cinerariifolium]
DVRKNIDAPIIEEWVLDDEDEVVTQPKSEQKTVKPSIPKIEFVKPKQPEKKARKTIKKIVDNCTKGLGYENYNVVPPPYTENFMPLKPDLYFRGLDKFANKPVVENYNAKTSESKFKDVRKNIDAPIIEEWVLDDEDE